jgi:serine protease Do
VGLICSMVSGVASGAAVMYWLPKSGSASQAQTTQSSSNSTVYYKTTPLSTTAGSLSVTEIAKKVGPAVVGVSIKTADSTDQFGFPVDGEEGMGSGIIFNEDGYILTNYHVIEGASKISVIFNNKKEVAAKVVNYNSDLDLAVIKVTENVKMPAVAEFGNSKDVQVGESVVAIGNPLGKELLGTVTAGVISAANREIKVGNSTQTLLQTDAAINPGNSGGALVNQFGQVIGINSSKISESGVEGLGFAIPIDVVKPQINSLLKPILLIGISCRDITSDIAKRYNMPEGVYVAQVQQYSAAEKAGIQAGDVIVKFDGKEVKTTSSMNTLKSSHKSGDVVSIQVYRDGKYMNLTLKLSE